MIEERYIGKKVVVRTYSAGNFFGELIAYDSRTGTIILKNSRRMHRWFTDKGCSLSEIATYGTVYEKSRINTPIPEMIIAEVIELIPATEEAIQNLENSPIYQPQ